MKSASHTPELLFIDLNNFAAYPTLAVGYLIRSLRDAQFKVRLLSPLALGVPAFTRDNPENWKDQLIRRLYFSGNPIMNRSRDFLREQVSRWNSRPHPAMVAEVERAIAAKPAAILIFSIKIINNVLIWFTN